MIRKPVGEGRFYPSDNQELFRFLSLNIKEEDLKSSIIIAPHAGYIYSGKTAARSFSHLERDFETAFIIGTAHTIYARKPQLISKCIFKGSFATISTDDEIIEILMKDENFENNPNAHIEEHSIEVMLPFLYYINKNFKIVPIVVNGEDREILINSAKVIASLMKRKKSVCIISTDLSHYPPYDISKVVDNAISLSYKISIVNKDIDYFFLTKRLLEEKYRKYLDTIACGFSAMVMGGEIAMNLEYNDCEIVECINSGDIIENDNVVGYLSAFFSKDRNEFKLNLSPQEKDYLLSNARKSIEKFIKEKKILSDYAPFPKLNIPFAVFITLYKGKNLRGCIGSLNPHLLLSDAVNHYAVKSAFDDPRFTPLGIEELKKTTIEISILSPLKKIKDISEIKENISGVYVKNGYKSGTYLPQVWEYFKTKEEFLKSLFDEKSGIGYKNLNDPETEIYTYTVEKIKE